MENIKKLDRICSVCNKSFKAISDKQWENVKYMHEQFSIRHKDYKNLKN